MNMDRNISENIERKQLTWLEHVKGMPEDDLEKYCSGFLLREERKDDQGEVGVTILIKQWKQEEEATACDRKGGI